jgi:hypothetical protein
MHQTMPDHLILSLEAFPPLRSRAAFYRTTIQTVAVADTPMIVEKVLLDVSERVDIRALSATDLRLERLGSAARISTLKSSNLRVRNNTNAHTVNGHAGRPSSGR